MTAIDTKAISEMGRDEILMTWQNVKSILDAAKTREAELRAAIVDREFASLTDGTQNVELGKGYILKAVGKLNYNLDSDKTNEALDELIASGNDGPFVAERLVKFKPSLSVSEYKKLTPERQRFFDEALTITQGAPTLTIVEPKVKGRADAHKSF